ncbi:hypothetical protein FKM82_029409, partial [Ascaphus truei]
MLRFLSGPAPRAVGVSTRRGVAGVNERIGREERQRRRRSLQEEHAAQISQVKGQRWGEKEVIQYEIATEPGKKK